MRIPLIVMQMIVWLHYTINWVKKLQKYCLNFPHIYITIAYGDKYMFLLSELYLAFALVIFYYICSHMFLLSHLLFPLRIFINSSFFNFDDLLINILNQMLTRCFPNKSGLIFKLLFLQKTRWKINLENWWMILI